MKMNSSSSEDESSSDEELKEVAMNLSESISKQISMKRQEQCVESSMFVLDRRPQIAVQSPGEKQKAKNSQSKEDHKRAKKKKNYDGLSSYIHSNINLMDPKSFKQNTSKEGTSSKKKKKEINQKSKPDSIVQEIMKKSVITPDFEKQDSLEPYEESLRKLKQKRRKERAQTKGKGWFGMTAPEMTDDAKMNLEMLKMRKALDPKRFYKGNDMKGLPKFFQFGKVVESAADFYHSRVPKKQRKANLVQELLADAEFRKFNKRKYTEVQEAKMKGDGPYKRMKRVKRNKKNKV
ncbi:deoxynucleotidyltransferase terminal-interacting protein 2-like [Ostrea edulis]|uniref:deoxynucleotidyltransferase terminal-interacting protein 2-like n=1 Tax=Ostrea edulis TaxID=37623 RepID=UPI0024AF7D7C|nr:deoxynucleotidyltransferase terminal-interacting protein 2-like [Ostrea edulis]